MQKLQLKQFCALIVYLTLRSHNYFPYSFLQICRKYDGNKGDTEVKCRNMVKNLRGYSHIIRGAWHSKLKETTSLKEHGK